MLKVLASTNTVCVRADLSNPYLLLGANMEIMLRWTVQLSSMLQVIEVIMTLLEEKGRQSI